VEGYGSLPLVSVNALTDTLAEVKLVHVNR
jgi:hypothetical protein